MAKLIPRVNDLATLCPELAAQWHPTKNSGFSPVDVTYGSAKKAWWLCPKCGHEWQASIYSRHNGKGCPKCGYISRKKNKIMKTIQNNGSLQNKNPKVAAEWHPTKNGDLLPSMVTAGAGKKVWWKCDKCGHEWQAIIANRSNGTGCPVCAKNKRKGKTR